MDALLRAINEAETIRVVAATTSEAVREACRRQQARGVAAVAIGRGLTAGVLLATLAKQDRERIRIQFAGRGPAGHLMVDAHGDGRVRACLEHALAPDHPALRPDLHAARTRTAALIGGRGELVVTRELGLEQGYQGVVAIESGEIDEDLQNYLDRSEQLPSALRCEVVLDGKGEVVRAAGVLAQSFPGSPPELIAEVRERLAPGELARLIEPHERALDELVGFALGGEGFRRMLEYPIAFHCPCGPERAVRVLSSLGAADLDALADEQEVTEVRCNFCGNVTRLGAAEVREVAAQLRASQS
ncbi:Hsp33 family molecular chaperone HslO [Nannocystaceae bacterium ST9]